MTSGAPSALPASHSERAFSAEKIMKAGCKAQCDRVFYGCAQQMQGLLGKVLTVGV